jgi:hypothetical protein
MNKAYLWLGRFVGTAVLIYSVYLFVVTVANLIADADYESSWIAAWVLGSGVVGTVSSLVFLLTIDGPDRFLVLRYRMLSWWLMFLSILLPTSISFFLAPLTATTVGLSFQRPQRLGRHVGGRHLKST